LSFAFVDWSTNCAFVLLISQQFGDKSLVSPSSESTDKKPKITASRIRAQTLACQSRKITCFLVSRGTFQAFGLKITNEFASHIQNPKKAVSKLPSHKLKLQRFTQIAGNHTLLLLFKNAQNHQKIHICRKKAPKKRKNPPKSDFSKNFQPKNSGH
jgi:hypothetical protein